MGPPNLFMMFAPLEGWRHVKVTDRHTAVDYAHVLKDLADTLGRGLQATRFLAQLDHLGDTSWYLGQAQ